MRKLLLIIALCLTLQPLCARAVTPLDPDREASLTVIYQKDGAVFPDVKVAVYRVAEAFPSGKFQLIAPFSGYPVNIHDIMEQARWTDVANTLNAYIVADKIVPDGQTVTDEAGLAKFASLKTGLYFVEEVMAENANGTYLFNRFLVYLPTPQPDGYDYEVEARPKCTAFAPKTQYTVTKLWQDGGKQENRPKAVTVDIYRDGDLTETQTLSGENDWTYTWSVSADDHGIWSVAERDVPEGYQVTVKENGSSFSLINTAQSQPDIPLTGDSYNPLPLVVILCISGIGLVLLGLYIRRRK